MIHRSKLRAVALLLAVVTASASAHAESNDTPRSIEVAAGNILSRINLVRSDLREAVMRERRYPLARRFVDATLAYQRGNYSLSSVLLYDLVMTPKFQRRTDYYNALFMLGTSLYRLRNFYGAQRYLSLIVKFTNRKYFVPTLTALVDIAIRMGKYDLVSQYTTYLGAVPWARGAHMYYQFGRSFFVAKRFEQARKFLAQVDPGEKDYPAARFYLGVLKVRAKDLKAATTEFESVVQAGQMRDVRRRPRPIVVDYARLSLARIYLEQKNFDKAIDQYVAIDRNSVVAEEALFELAATFVAAKKFKRALDTLDILLLDGL